MARQMPGRFVLPGLEASMGTRVLADEGEADSPIAKRGWQRIRALRSVRPYDLFPSLFNVKRSELAIFSRQLATFIGAGVSLTQAIAVLQQEARSRKMREVLGAIQTDLARGSSVADALSRFPEVFTPLYLNLVRAAELTGTLDTVLRRLDVHLTREDRASKEIRAAMTYPALVLLMAAGSVVVMVGFVLPRFAELFAEFNAELPFTTQLLLAVANLVKDHGLAMLAGLAVVIVAIVASQFTERGKRVRDAIVLRTPVVGTLARYAAIARFCRTLATMLEAGVPLARSFDIVLGSISNRILRTKVEPVKALMMSGEGFAGPLGATGVFPPTVVQMVRVGEETGSLDRFLGESAQFYESELEYKLQGAIQLLEPALMLSVGGVIGFVAISMVSAIYALTGSLK